MDTALQSSVYVSSPEFAGWLVKRGFHWRKLWKRRWVALHGAEIVYMEKEPTLENSATMNITKAQITTATVIDREDIDGNPNGFAIHVNDGHTPTWYLRAESAREKKSWLMRLAHVHAIVKWLEDFEKVKVLGVGGTGIVYELLHKTNGQRFAMKEMEIKNKAQMQMAVSEAEMLKDIMENVSHPNIMHIEKVFQVGSKFYLVFPLCMGGELYEHIIRRGHFTEHDAAVIIRDLISGLQALHQHDILHLDIKPENILFDTMEDDAKIRITDFGLSKMFSLVQGAQEKSKDQFTPEMMAEKLKAFQESGELNRERLRGTVGYMSPELILTGHCSKATDVFAAGVVLYILLCGRPPFNSKSNREVLEKTAKGTYKLTGAEWEDVSAEAKDLVRMMLKTNPLERASTEEILAHPWIKQLEAEEAEEALQKSRSGSDSTSGGGGGAAVSRTGTSGSAGGRKNTNLAGALRMLSGHVRHLRSEKLATSMTRIVSMMQNGPGSGSGSTLANMYLVPSKKGNKESMKKIAEIDGGGGDAAAAAKAEEDDDDAAATAVTTDVELLFMNGDVRDAVTEAIYNVVDNDEGKLTLEQFLVIAKHFHTSLAAAGGGGAASGGASAGIGIVHLLICRFVDRDGDGFISVDDLFAAQALIIQRSEVFIRLLFRLFTESIWYPGRQLNLQNLLSHTNLKNTVGSGDNNNSSSSNSSDSKQNSSSSSSAASSVSSGADLRRNSSNSIKVLDSKAGSGGLLDVVEPPKFITARHVTAVFEKLGYEGEGGQKAFNTLCEALARLKAGAAATGGGAEGGGGGGEGGGDFTDATRGGGGGGIAATAGSPPPKGRAASSSSSSSSAAASPLGSKAPSGRNSALAAALDEDFDDEEESDDDEESDEQDEWGMGGGGLSSKQGGASKGSSSSARKSPSKKKPQQASATGDRASMGNSSSSATAVTPGSSSSSSSSSRNSTTTRESASGGLAGDAFHSPLYSSAAATARTRASSGVWQASPGGGEAVAAAAAGAGVSTPPPPSPAGSSAGPTPNPPSAAAAASAANMKMDVNDFIRAIELDDIFLQAVFRRPRHKMVKLMQKVDERSKLEAKVREQHYKLAQEDPAAAAAMLKAAEEKAAAQLSRGRTRTQSVASMETQSVFEEELRAAFAKVSLSDGVARPKFPVLAAVGRLGLGAAFGFAGKLAKATGAVVEATLETLEGGDEDPDSDDSDGRDSGSDGEDSD